MNIGIIAPEERIRGWVSTFIKYDENVKISVYPDIDYEKLNVYAFGNNPRMS